MPGAIATMAMAEAGTLLNAPTSMKDRDRSRLSERHRRSRCAGRAEHPRTRQGQGVGPAEITALILDRPRHADLIAGVRRAGGAVRLITDGDVAGVIHTADPPTTGIDIYIGVGGAPEECWPPRRCAASAARCSVGSCSTPKKSASGRENGIKDPRKKYEIGDLVKGDCLFAATGVTNGALLTGVRFRKDVIETETVVMRSITGTVRWIRGEHRQLEKFHLDLTAGYQTIFTHHPCCRAAFWKSQLKISDKMARSSVVTVPRGL